MGEAVVAMAEGKPQPLVAARRSDDRDHVGDEGTRSHPRRRQPLSDREHAACDRLDARQLHRRLGTVARTELHPGAEPDAVHHRGEGISVLDVDQRQPQRLPGRRRVGHVVPAFPTERHPVSQRPEDDVRPGTEGNDGVLRRDPPGCGLDLPSARSCTQGTRIAGEEGPAFGQPACRDAPCDRLRTCRRQRILGVDRAGKLRRHARLDRGKVSGIKVVELQSVLRKRPCRCLCRRKLLRRPIERKPASRPIEIARAGVLGERHVLCDRILEERPDRRKGASLPRRRRGTPVGEQPRRHPRQGPKFVAGIELAIERISPQFAQLARKGRRIERGALDQPQITEGRGGRDLRAVHQRRLDAPQTKVRGNRDPDDPRTDDDHVDFRVGNQSISLRGRGGQRAAWYALRFPVAYSDAPCQVPRVHPSGQTGHDNGQQQLKIRPFRTARSARGILFADRV